MPILLCRRKSDYRGVITKFRASLQEATAYSANVHHKEAAECLGYMHRVSDVHWHTNDSKNSVALVTTRGR
jgi:hypothetical protein